MRVLASGGRVLKKLSKGFFLHLKAQLGGLPGF